MGVCYDRLSNLVPHFSTKKCYWRGALKYYLKALEFVKCKKEGWLEGVSLSFFKKATHFPLLLILMYKSPTLCVYINKMFAIYLLLQFLSKCSKVWSLMNLGGKSSKWTKKKIQKNPESWEKSGISYQKRFITLSRVNVSVRLDKGPFIIFVDRLCGWWYLPNVNEGERGSMVCKRWQIWDI